MSDPACLEVSAAAFPALMMVAAEVVVLTLDERTLRLALVAREEPPLRGRPALPGAFVGADEELDRAARRALRERVGVDAPVRQCHAFGGIGRDPRGPVVSIGYVAVLALRELRPLRGEQVRLAELRDGVVRGDGGRKLALPFDHAGIVSAALASLRLDLETSSFSFGLLGPEFSLRELQYAHEAIRGVSLNKPAFRKRLLDSGRLVATGRRESDQRFRPAELYRLREEPGDA